MLKIRSTIARIMMGMYRPTKGNVYLNGNNTKDFSHEGLLRNTSAVFQKYQKYFKTLMATYDIDRCESILSYSFPEITGKDYRQIWKLIQF